MSLRTALSEKWKLQLRPTMNRPTFVFNALGLLKLFEELYASEEVEELELLEWWKELRAFIDTKIDLLEGLEDDETDLA